MTRFLVFLVLVLFPLAAFAQDGQMPDVGIPWLTPAIEALLGIMLGVLSGAQGGWVAGVGTVLALVAMSHPIASAITAMTDTPKDDAWVAWIYRKIIEPLALVTKRTKQGGNSALILLACVVGLACASGPSMAAEMTDTDGDGVLDSVDNCTELFNADQIDGDGDGYGNGCDADFDQSGGVDIADFGIFMRGRMSGEYDVELDIVYDLALDDVDIARLRVLFGKAPGPSAGK